MTFSKHLRPSNRVREYAALLEGACDLHVHTGPDVFQRAVDDIELLESLDQLGYSCFLLKNHYFETVSRAYLLNKLGKRARALGSIVMNNSYGGLNPSAAEKALIMGAAEVWMPTFDSENHRRISSLSGGLAVQKVRTLRSYKETGGGITVLNDSGELRPEVMNVLELIAESDAILGTGHLSLREVYRLVEAARKVGVRRILVTHPNSKFTRFSADDQIRLASMGAVMEQCAVTEYDPKGLADDIRRVGVGNCIISSDSGIPSKGHPVDVLIDLIIGLKDNGISDSDIERLIKRNPAKLVEGFV
ncbi:MAG: DUF6282 family protein [Aigarchaeota archaeon]|nr:DUF6282 family protein [Aigarchaeota archaeon]MDW8093284.1 DUF6282 family protein [Nitrososphaerota archaeon]